MVTKFFVAGALSGFALTASVAAELAPGSGHSVRLAAFDGVIYYTIGQDGYRVVATLASGADALPIRVISTLAPGQRLVISAPRSLGQPSVDFEVSRYGDALFVSDAVAAAETDFLDKTPASALSRKW